ncbi:glycosyltransferase [Sphingomonas rhizophila]|uniref:Glycosyltransferase n=1 Tax=Sphingomonas rhizophila TaxID=2071607 RepID=A0A7G9SBU1_9SPHN|nr:glycosyltransferase family 2 protein [Sphingomonas rhizophila]QNN65316.1 glycosyltransferase [Sphingomonas rhizophila]
MSIAKDRQAAQAHKLGIVVIGRNEGERLARCLKSLAPLDVPIVYADSSSTDDSVSLARAAGVTVVQLSAREVPLNAARGRNAGFEALQRQMPDVAFVQFIDGDCLIEEGWISTGLDHLSANPKSAVACGRRREAQPDASFYNRLADEEWATPVGRAQECGGDSIMRVAALDEVGLFDPGLTAGEEPELCSRLRGAGWEIWRLDAAMTVHDMAMFRIGQWFRRARRSGYGYAQAYRRTRRSNRPLYGVQLRSAVLWAALLPAATIILTLVSGRIGALLPLPIIYLMQIARMAAHRGIGSFDSWRYAALMLLSKGPELVGAIEGFAGEARRKQSGQGS